MKCRDAALVSEYASFWKDEVLLPKDTLAAAGVAYHIADMLLHELARIVEAAGAAPPSADTLRTLLNPFIAAFAETKDSVMIYRLRQGLFSGIAEAVSEAASSGPFSNLDSKALAEHLFELGECTLKKT